MKRSYQIMIFATLCLAAMVSPVAVQAQGDESWPEISSTIENWPADDPLGYERYVVEKFFDQEHLAKAIYELVSNKAGECEAIPPEEWNVTLRDGVNQDCSQKRSGGIAGEGRSVANEIGYFLSTLGGMTFSGDEPLYCLPPKSESNFSTYVESACWPSNNPILDRLSSLLGSEDNSVRLTMKLPLMVCLGENTTFPIKNVTVVADLPLCLGNAGPWARPTSPFYIFDMTFRDVFKMNIMLSSIRIVDPPLHELEELLDGLLE